jgi:hypothetical protein
VCLVRHARARTTPAKNEHFLVVKPMPTQMEKAMVFQNNKTAP